MSNILIQSIEGRKYHLICCLWLLFLLWRTSVYLGWTSTDEGGIIQGMVFASHHGYQRGIKAHLSRLDREQQELIFPLSYSGTLKAYNLPPGEYQLLFTKQGYHPEKRKIIITANSLTQIPPMTLKRSLGSDYFYHFVHGLNILAFFFLLITGIGAYRLRQQDLVAKAFLRFCVILSWWSFWGIVSYVLQPLGQTAIGGHLTYLALWAYSFIAVSYCHVLAVFPRPIFGAKTLTPFPLSPLPSCRPFPSENPDFPAQKKEAPTLPPERTETPTPPPKTKRFLSWLYFPACLLFPVEFIRVFFWYRPDYSRFLGFPPEPI